MDKIVLNQTQIQAIRTYIGKRSFSFQEPTIMLEILDHFACKVEEKMMEGLSFEQAMDKAHASFGIKGFAPIAEHAAQAVISKYKRLRKKIAFQLLFSFHTVGIIAIGIFIYMILSSTNWIQSKRIGFALFGVQLIFTFLVNYFAKTYNKRLVKHPTFQAVAINYAPVLFALFIPVYGFSNVDTLPIGIAPIIYSTYLCLLLFLVLIQWQVGKEIDKDINYINEQIKAIS